MEELSEDSDGFSDETGDDEPGTLGAEITRARACAEIHDDAITGKDFEQRMAEGLFNDAYVENAQSDNAWAKALKIDLPNLAHSPAWRRREELLKVATVHKQKAADLMDRAMQATKQLRVQEAVEMIARNTVKRAIDRIDRVYKEKFEALESSMEAALEANLKRLHPGGEGDEETAPVEVKAARRGKDEVPE